MDGAIGMARGQDLDSASSQFYICDGEQHNLDENYAVFGFVVEGIEVVRSIASVPVYGNTRPALSQHPVDDDWLYSVRIRPGYLNETDQLPDGPTASTVSGGGISGAGVAVMAVVVAVPLALIPLTFVMFRKAKAKGER
jgi:hypothetical protein